jgi:hypothetical protein
MPLSLALHMPSAYPAAYAPLNPLAINELRSDRLQRDITV